MLVTAILQLPISDVFTVQSHVGDLTVQSSVVAYHQVCALL